eukprot:jgi/Botrbrau1/1409/Bobra.0063s0106.2
MQFWVFLQAVVVPRCTSANSKPPGRNCPKRLEDTKITLTSPFSERVKGAAREREAGAAGKSTVSWGLAGLLPLLVANNATAETEVPVVLFGLSPIETVLLFAPVTLYGVFWVYRSAINPQAKVNTVIHLFIQVRF